MGDWIPGATSQKTSRLTLFKGETVVESIPKIGGGSPLGLVIAGLIITVALIPFFAFRELSRVMGKGAGNVVSEGTAQ
jgi:hypothetical protein